MLRKPGDRFPATGVAYTLAVNDDLLIRKDVTFRSADDDGIAGAGPGARITINGTLLASDNGMGLSVDDIHVTVGEAGRIFTGGIGVFLLGDDVAVNNAGQISGMNGIRLSGDGDIDAGPGRITNSGTITAEQNAIFSGSNSAAFVVNSGTIRSFTTAAVVLSFGNDSVVNSGLIVGDVDLGSGNDLYDGRRGAVVGSIFGSAGNDRFVAGRGMERFFGGTDVDAVDYRDSGGVRAALDASFVGTGRATRDTFSGIENLFGSLTGADVLRGDGADNVIRGYGGNDTIDGSFGNDTINGGAGADTITTGLGINRIAYDKASHGGDILADFSSANDDIYVNRKGFGIAASHSLGAVDADLYHTGTSKQAAEADDRFIFRTTDDTLWFDRDGTGSKYAPVLIADSANTDILATDIFLF